MTKVLLQRLGDDYKNKIIQKQKARGIVASGRSAQSLRVEVSETTVRVFGSITFIWQEYGRGPSINPNAIFVLRAKIRPWIDDKGIVPVGITKDALGFLISRKIHERGTRLWRKLNEGEANSAQKVGLEETAKEIVQLYRIPLQKQLLVSFRSEIIRNLKISL